MRDGGGCKKEREPGLSGEINAGGPRFLGGTLFGSCAKHMQAMGKLKTGDPDVSVH